MSFQDDKSVSTLLNAVSRTVDKSIALHDQITSLDEQIARFNEALSLVKTFTASSLSKETASDIESSLKIARSLFVKTQHICYCIETRY